MGAGGGLSPRAPLTLTTGVRFPSLVKSRIWYFSTSAKPPCSSTGVQIVNGSWYYGYAQHATLLLTAGPYTEAAKYYCLWVRKTFCSASLLRLQGKRDPELSSSSI